MPLGAHLPQNPVGASLLAKRPVHPTSPQTDTPPSRAGSLPQEKRDPSITRSATRPPRGGR
ncbi:hypothetical protein FHK92_20945 [Pseudomonas brassicacearum subsp. neoaurantiaca]|uniref:Uncharacterized protein n=1 Tax=Pseudomonas brassicacearum subsp. neoaurantiaca TaxID=494916 RepID=A0A7V8UER7_9PSED|nr:hypothetical protein [Pseudomonas brassicacearum subsp. neoaurantiaca]